MIDKSKTLTDVSAPSQPRKVVDGAYARSKTKFPEDSRKRGVREEGEGDKKMK